MRLISKEELKEKLDQNHDFKLVFVLGDWHYRAKRIPGSLHLENAERAEQELNKDDEIVVYCANVFCAASIFAYNHLVNSGYQNVRRYAEGIQGWEEAGYPLEGEEVRGF